MKVLLTGFEPFGGQSVNPAFLAINCLDDMVDCDIIKLEIPTVFGKSFDKIREIVDIEKPDIILSIGQAGGRNHISMERIAINLDDARIPDNEGNQPIDTIIRQDGENAYFSNLPIKAMVKSIREHKIPSQVSNTAGTYVCNHVMYEVLHMIHKENSHIRAGFMHVPFLPEQAVGQNAASMSLTDITKAIEVAIKAIINNRVDIAEAYGKNH